MKKALYIIAISAVLAVTIAAVLVAFIVGGRRPIETSSGVVIDRYDGFTPHDKCICIVALQNGDTAGILLDTIDCPISDTLYFNIYENK